jgi:hypothetical protein
VVPNNKVKINHVLSCNLGKIASNGIALKINFAADSAKIKDGPHRSVVFGMSRKAALGLAQALIALLKEPDAEKAKPTRN